MNARILRKVNTTPNNLHESWALQCQMMAEEEESTDELSTDILMACGMLSELESSIVTNDLKNINLHRGVTQTNLRTRKHYSDHGPAVYPRDESNKDVKAATNFHSENEMLAFIILVCNGDWDRMTESVTGIMTWFEEWYFYFEFMWGRTMTTWNVAARKKGYGIKESYLRRVFDSKLRMVLCQEKVGRHIVL